MILWLASYPKSGNTFLRCFLSTYFFSQDGKFNFNLLKNILSYPKNSLFSEIGVNINNRHEVAKNHLNVQELINKNKKNFQFLKTHSSLARMDGYSFTDLNNTLGVIYLVRDPRDVVISYAHHNDQTIEQTVKMINENYIIGDDRDVVPTYLGSWSNNYNSWKALNKSNRYLCFKYEDLVTDQEKSFKEILIFIKHLSKMQFEIDENKIKIVLKNIEFEKLKKMETREGFKEAKTNKKGELIKFFREGKVNQWENNLDSKIKNSIETACQKEMKELGYL
tara:strand:- start:518 stop:1354 length:837 start_codon:yes stop_codon:yes gene_type:complete